VEFTVATLMAALATMPPDASILVELPPDIRDNFDGEWANYVELNERKDTVTIGYRK